MNHMIDALNHDTDFQTLIKKYESPNCFRIMGRTRREEWHSNFVCWLLDPSSNHNLGNFPLKMFFELIKIDIDEIDFDQTIFKTEVSIENGRIDILGESEKFILIIENKLDARETYNAKEKNFKRMYILNILNKKKIIKRNKNIMCI
ncbi:MAG: PD-(D/E)XK nuclease family protein [Blautia sp.]|uniref:PD-(D/E)XK nuclease family protein n=1 Tax=Blautia sp. TaxID=1955243 RepID=UPI002E787597|nr:PD-(D/E)XK nuclease family protein [Blautia sp.]MEE1444694.1 PD-(D/E)XK nuclease family protein [Blautia sp.]